ncbi:NADP-dependent oxidoreductase [Spongiibacter sp. KMU-166]|uniref:NADP-dependent oxidoreductase n=1 Tax=Spongiibacter thalassae TaxID=2721624 RepID=A0ABX1GCP7_9GAMM|nr:NADP-dependent oxidoreductase [Spongiibacter thalassae]NKI16726.1 NADP-dependent oxidoreductase [Spongiibacter thalassae]
MTTQPTQVRFNKPAEGIPGNNTWTITHDPIADPREGEIAIKLHYLSIDPAIKGWITDKKSYIEAVKPGDVMRGFGVAEVIASESDYFSVGDFCTGFTGIQTHATMDSRQLRKIDPQLAPLSRFMGGLGMPGFTAYFGLLDIGKPAPGETVVVSSAAGAVGHIVAQIAKLKGCRVVGIAGGEAKCAYLRDELKLDAVIDYREGNLPEALAVAAPEGVDVYFDGVGGETLDAVLMVANRHARIIACGAVSQYANLEAPQGLGNYMLVITQSLMIKGFTMRDYMHRIKEAFIDLLTWEHEGKVVFREHILNGIECYPEAVKMIYSGKNNGKLMIKVSD